MIRKRLTALFSIICLGLLMVSYTEPVHADRAMISTAEGTGTFRFTSLDGSTGYYFGPGSSAELGNLIFSGSMEIQPIKPGQFRFQNLGRGTDQEALHEVIYEDGSSLSARFRGHVRETPVVDDDGNPTGQFTARWTGNWVIVKGTGRFRGAKGSFRVTAVNDPYSPTDANRNFSWSWRGNLALPNRPNRADIRVLHAEGVGSFDPANLGVGDPAMFPLVIGDGSGAGIYNGTPVGVYSLDGVEIGPDQHFGTAQSIIGPGTFSPAGTIWYPGVTGLNPDGVSGPIHRMVTAEGEIWFNYTYYFDFDLTFGVTGRANFRVVGGTGMFEGAKGSVFVLVVSELGDISGLPDAPVAVFTYDFQGYIELNSDN